MPLCASVSVCATAVSRVSELSTRAYLRPEGGEGRGGKEQAASQVVSPASRSLIAVLADDARGSGARGVRRASRGRNHSNAGIGRDVTSRQTAGNGRGMGEGGGERGRAGRNERARGGGLEEGEKKGKGREEWKREREGQRKE